MSRKPKIERFNDHVLSKYQIYNSIFTTLPFDKIEQTGRLLPLFSQLCAEGYEKKLNPSEIVDGFFEKHKGFESEKEKNDTLFKFIQYIERQVVLFDAIEDAAFRIVNNMDGRGTMRNLKEAARANNQQEELIEYLKRFKVRPVLTAHPTQFYPGTVLGIITDLAKVILNDDLQQTRKLLAQLGKTPFFKKEKPTPYHEAMNLIWYLQHIFYHSASNIYNYISQNIMSGQEVENEIINLGFWPGGDRDGNPFVTTETTLKVAKSLRRRILYNYYKDIRLLRRRLTFPKIPLMIQEVEYALYDTVHSASAKPKISLADLKSKLQEIRELIVEEHKSLFLEELDDLINKVKLFGFHFASLDIRQDSRVHHNVFENVIKTAEKQLPNLFPKDFLKKSEVEQIAFLGTVKGKLDPELIDDEMTKRTISSIYAIKTIQEENGERGCNRYIISNNQTALNVMETFAMIRLTGWNDPTVDVVPLFETVPDLKVAHEVMRVLYSNKAYRNHVKRRGDKQTIMLGFSDGTKDGGYLMANWSIFKAKEELTKVSREYGIKVIFFDGRGGPPARGGGNTHQFYASLGPTIENEEIQLTIQGQTISSNFGTKNSSQYNLEQLISSGITNAVLGGQDAELNYVDRATMDALSELSYQAYVDFKNHPKFLPYLEHMSTLKYYAKTNIGSRPSKRGKSSKLDFSDLRAIPFVGSWSQLKQNVPGFYGVGIALKYFDKNGEFDKVKSLYENSAFFRTLIGNSMMSLTKSFFPLTAYMKNDEEYGDFWKLIYDEYETTKALLLKLTGQKELMDHEPAGRASIHVREKIVLPLLTIQQFALRKVKEIEAKTNKTPADKKAQEVYEKMVTRSLFGNINASRNSA